MFICAVFMGLLLQHCQNDQNQYIADQVKSARIVAQVIEEQKSSQYRKRIKSIINYKISTTREKILQAFARQDRDELLRLTRPMFEILKTESSLFSTFGWVLPDNHAFLRVHNPKKFGEDVSKMRPDVVAANRDHKQYAGFTAGYVGLQYRIVQPVMYEGQHLGTIQFGLQDSLLLDPIQEKLHIPVALVLPNEKYAYIKRSKLLHLPGPSHTIQARDISLFKGKEDDFDWSQDQQRIELQGRDYVVVKVLELRNFAEQIQGHVFVALDISAKLSELQTLLISVFCMSVVILFLSFLILNTSYGRLVERIVHLNESLERNNRELEDRVKERTDTLFKEIEERKLAEKERAIAEEKALRSSKMEAIGLMAGGVAHDLNNILSGIISYPELMLLQLPKSSKLRKPLEAIHASGKRAATVVADLLTVARGVACVREPHDINVLIEEYLNSPECVKLKSQYPAVACKQHLVAQNSIISCSPVHVKKTIMNLVTNAVEAIGEKGTIRISTSNRQVSPSKPCKHTLDPGNYVLVIVQDDGPGIPEHDREHIFEPFYTKKVMGRSGTGLGLAIVWNTLQDHNGKVIVESSAEGTIFYLYFPLSHDKEAIQPATQEAIITTINKEYILVIDDEPQLRDIASQMLTTLGYKVDSVSSGEQAIEFLEKKQVDLIVIDMLMEPGLNGRETYEKILAMQPGQKAVIATGFSESDDVKATLQLGAGGFIKKPYSIDQLSQAVKKALNS
jgi:signal transduction histidine kinase/CheY-like chemotaxis protein